MLGIFSNFSPSPIFPFSVEILTKPASTLFTPKSPQQAWGSCLKSIFDDCECSISCPDGPCEVLLFSNPLHQYWWYIKHEFKNIQRRCTSCETTAFTNIWKRQTLTKGNGLAAPWAMGGRGWPAEGRGRSVSEWWKACISANTSNLSKDARQIKSEVFKTQRGRGRSLVGKMLSAKEWAPT